MGIYLNPGNDGFEKAIRSEIYVDKTGLIVYTKQQFVIGARKQGITEYLEQEVLEELLEEYGYLVKKQDIGLADALRRIYAKTGKKVRSAFRIEHVLGIFHDRSGIF